MTDSGLTPADIGAVVGGSGGRNDSGWGSGDAWVLIILFALIFGNGWFGGNGAGAGNSGGGGVTEAGLCNSMNFNNLENAVGRLADSQNAVMMSLQSAFCQNGYETLQNFNTVNTSMLTGFNGIQSQIAQCCCDTQRQIDSVNYNMAMNTSQIVQSNNANTQKILDVLCQNRQTDMQNQINQLQLQNALAGVVRYPSGYTYSAGASPFCQNGCGCSGNI